MVTTYLKRAYSSFATHVLDVPPRLLAFLIFMLLLLFPLTKPTSGILLLLTLTNIGAIFAMSWDLLVGRTGQMSLGHAVFFGLGGYTTALLWRHYHLSPWVTITLSLPIGALVALLVGFPCLRVKGPYLSLVTFVLPLIVGDLIKYAPYIRYWTGGDMGIWPLPRLFPFLDYETQFLAQYLFTLLLLLVSGIILYKVANSKTGIVFVSILDDELASEACGINTTKYKLMAFVISGFFATLAGSINVYLLYVLSPAAVFDPTISFMPVIITIFGGIGTIYGPIAGAFILQLLDMYVLKEIVVIPPDWVPAKMLIYALVIVIFIIKWPRGVARFVTDKLEDLQEKREIEERGRWIWKRYRRKRGETTHEA